MDFQPASFLWTASVACRYAAVALLAFGTAPAALAGGTPAGTDIENAAQIIYEVGGDTLTHDSNVVTITVAEILDVDVSLQSGPVAVSAGDSSRELLLMITNTGNGSETFSLAIDSALAADDFDPIPAVPAIYFDSDASGDFSAGDTAYNPGVNDPTLLPDISVNVLIVNDMPGGLNDGDIGLSLLRATSTTGTGAPGDVFANAGDGGVDALVGSNGGEDTDVGQYVVSAIQFTVVKSASVVDPFGGTLAVPGAQITYQVVLTPEGSGTAANSTFTDAIPTDTTYVPGTLALNGVGLTDVADSDSGEFISSPIETLNVALGDLTGASGAQTVTFAVIID